MIDRDLARIYQVETKVLNQAVKRNIERFPETFRFQISKEELNELVTNCDQFKTLKHSKTLPYMYTEQGVAMLSAVLRSERSVQISIQIIQAFVAMRKTLNHLHAIIQRLEGVELKQLVTDNKLEKILRALEKDYTPSKGIFFEGQLFDAHVFASNLIKKAKKSIVLIDNYVDETTLLLLSKREMNVHCLIHTHINNALLKDLEKYHLQYDKIEINDTRSFHDRFLIIDNSELYHIGASLKDLGKKCFAFSRMDDILVSVKQIPTNPY